MNFSSAEWILIITTITTGVVSIIGALRSGTNSRKLDDAKKDLVERATVQESKLDEIHTATNGNLHKALREIEELKREIKRLRTELKKKI